jgi:alkanesulfonate monooxygenase SsuD/methylene tetrahydromethanopterin reductase-like flavin-dependent oxidoreductase (luciferase family)
MFIGIITGKRKRLQPPVDNMKNLWTEYEEDAAKQMLQLSFIGSPGTIKTKMKDFSEQTGMNEIMVISNIFDQKAKLHSYKLFADVMKEIGN